MVQIKTKLRTTPLQPLTENGYLPDIVDAAAIIFQNVGTTNVRLFHGAYTVLANGGVLTLNATENFASIDQLQLDVMFQGAGTNRLEILVMRYGANDVNINC